MDLIFAKAQVPQGRYQECESEPSAGADEEKSELLVAGQSQGGVGLVARLGQEEPGKSGNPQNETENEGGAASFEKKQAVESVAGRGHLENATGGEEDQDQVVGNEGAGHGYSAAGQGRFTNRSGTGSPPCAQEVAKPNHQRYTQRKNDYGVGIVSGPPSQ